MSRPPKLVHEERLERRVSARVTPKTLLQLDELCMQLGLDGRGEAIVELLARARQGGDEVARLTEENRRQKAIADAALQQAALDRRRARRYAAVRSVRENVQEQAQLPREVLDGAAETLCRECGGVMDAIGYSLGHSACLPCRGKHIAAQGVG